jgi:hypothetical protein
MKKFSRLFLLLGILALPAAVYAGQAIRTACDCPCPACKGCAHAKSGF